MPGAAGTWATHRGGGTEENRIRPKKKAEADRRYDAAKREWDQMSDEARKMRPELDPELIRPRWRLVT
jgi:hypothetical protein